MIKTAQLLGGSLFITITCFSQNVGIGTNMPASRLHVRGTGAGTQIILEENAGSVLRISNEANATGPYIGTTTNHPLSFVTNNSVKLSITPGGSLGIGTNAPQKMLSVAGGAVIDQNNSNTGSSTNTLTFGSFSGEGIGSKRTAGPNQFGLDFYTSNQQRMTISSSGSVGIGTNTPHSSSILDISSTTAGITIPRLSKLQREAISNPQVGLMVFDLSYKAIFVFDGLNWLPLVPGSADGLTGGPQSPADNTIGSQFGYSTGIDSSWAIAGAPSQNNSIGAAYVFRRMNGDWIESSKLLPDDATPQLFGASVSIDYPYAVVGAPGHNTYSGCVYVFFHNGTSWVQIHKFFKPVNNAPLNYFGHSVDISGIHLVIGSPGADDVASNAGAVYTYRLNGSSWAFQSTLSVQPKLDVNAAFGTAVAVAGSNIVAGAPGQPVISSVTGMAFYYSFSAGQWTYITSLLPSSAAISLNIKDYGASVDIHFQPDAFYGVSIAVGAPASFFDFLAIPDIQNIGAVFAFWGTSTGILTQHSAAFALVENGNYAAYENQKYGAAVAVSHTGTPTNNFPGTIVNVHGGAPGTNNNKGAIHTYTIQTVFEQASGLATGAVTRTKNDVIKGNSSNNKLGAALDVFDRLTNIAGAPGSNANKGSVQFEY
ncbi:MAG: FG-GAP repeat protein [Chitinophagaceae bacterium]|nr:FG-GAP repeat protein [Chitinophagaceae bacterium]